MSSDDNGDAKGALPELPAKKKGISRRAVLKAGAAVTGAATAPTLSPAFRPSGRRRSRTSSCATSACPIRWSRRSATRRPRISASRSRCRISTRRPRSTASSPSPNSVDIADLEGWQAKLATKRGVIQGIEVKKIKEFDNILPIFTKGELDGHKIPRQGISPYEAMYIAKPTRPSCMMASPSGRPSCRRSTTRTRSATGPTSSVTR